MNLESKDLLVNNKQSCTKDIRSFYPKSFYGNYSKRNYELAE